jgi:hypothetical protein
VTPTRDRKPDRIGIRMYQVGFGDSFLVSFGYPRPLGDGRDERHLMIDFGSTRWPKGRRGYREIAADIAARTDGHLDVLVVTHRHKDHLAGFGDPNAAKMLTALDPDLVVQPWTEDPQLASDAPGPADGDHSARRFAANLAQAQQFADQLASAIGPGARGFRGMLAGLALEQVPNQAAIDTLETLARKASHGPRYVFAGQASGIEGLIPGVHARVLGPPTPEQWPAVTGQRADDPQYWIAWKGLLDRMVSNVAPAGGRRSSSQQSTTTVEPGPVRWLVERMQSQETHSLLRIVRSLDDAMNNTSVILLLTVGERRLLFPGDAQIENWSYSLIGPPARRLAEQLSGVDLYKVGHHGSRNASPRSLVRLWQERDRGLTAMMSTLPGVHGTTEATAVPRSTLVAALEALGPLVRTDKLPPEALYVDVTTTAITGPADFEYTQ